MRVLTLITTFVMALFAPRVTSAQEANAAAFSVPRLITVTGTFKAASGLVTPRTAVMTLSVYADATGGVALFQETQDVALDSNGRYTVQFGATQPDGLPVGLFANGQERWLGVQFAGTGEGEQPRTRLTSVPYALRAADADTLGGQPASAFVLAPKAASADAPTAAGKSAGTTTANDVQAGTPNVLAKYIDSVTVGNSAVVETGGAVGIGTATPLDFLHVRYTNTNGGLTGFAVQNLGNTATSYSGMLFYDQNGALGQFQGFNNVTHEYRINNIASGGTINFMIGGNSKFLVGNNGDITISGSLLKGGVPILYTTQDSTYVGPGAGNLRLGPNLYNVAVGAQALGSNAVGMWDVAYGAQALNANTQGDFNAAIGPFALWHNTTGSSNIAVGSDALFLNSTGTGNTAVGDVALKETTGTNNTAFGYAAGLNSVTGSNNIYLGANVSGTGEESNTMYLGDVNTQTRTFIAGVRGITTGAADAVTVMIDSAGQLGTVNSSRRYKEDIQDMGDSSSGLMKLRPVTFRYAQPYVDGSKPIDYGLIAEEVEAVYPDLVAHLADGQVETVQYHKINAMLLNEVQKQYRTLQHLHDQIETQATEIELLKARLLALETQRR